MLDLQLLLPLFLQQAAVRLLFVLILVYGGLAPGGKCDLEWLTNTEGLGLCTLAA